MSKDEQSESMTRNTLDEIYAFLGRFIVYPSEEAQVAHTLWIAHTYLMDEWYVSPMLAVLAPHRESGKTRVLEITALLVPRPELTAIGTAPVLYRMIGDPAGLPTILYDEIDTVFGPNVKKDVQDLRALFNSGYKRGTTIPRCEGNSFTPKRWPIYCAKALAGIGDLPETVLSRSVKIAMRRRRPTDQVEEYRSRKIDPEGHALREKIAAWAETQKGKIGALEPIVPDGVRDRDRELWEPLLAIADVVGEGWPQRARNACVTLVTAFRTKGEGSLSARLLSDLRSIFWNEERKEYEEKLPTTVIIDKLCILPESPWTTIINKNDRITPLYLSNKLKEYDIEPQQLWFLENGEDKQRRGYKRQWFADTWARYLPALPDTPEKASHPSQDQTSDYPEKPVTSVTSVTEVPPFKPLDDLTDYFNELERKHREEVS